MRSFKGSPIRRRVAYVFASGLTLSVALYAVFRYLTFVLPGVGDLGAYPGGPAKFASAYTSWFATRAEYAQVFQTSGVAAGLFTLALFVLIAPRVAVVISALSLNLFFAWTSHLFDAISQPLGNSLANIITVEDVLVWRVLGLASLSLDTQVVADLEGIAALLLMTALIASLNRHKGTGKALLLALQAAAGCMVILGIEIAAFDYSEFYLHVTGLQLTLNLAPWFTNADLLLSAVAVLAGVVGLSRQRRFRNRF